MSGARKPGVNYAYATTDTKVEEMGNGWGTKLQFDGFHFLPGLPTLLYLAPNFVSVLILRERLTTLYLQITLFIKYF